MNYEIIIATNNKDKVAEFKKYFENYTVDFLTLEDLKLKLNIHETGKTFLENAMIKAKAVAKSVNKTVIADDSGLQIDALKGFPGVHSSRWLHDHDYDYKNNQILSLLEGQKNRKAQYTCALVIHYPHKEMRFFVGTTTGKIAKEVDSGPNGFGYDPIFFSDDLQKNFSYASIEEKNSISHRGRAAEKLLQCLLDKKLITKVKKGR
jgi:XTP/dITP diphosphohydrolase